MTSHIHTYTYAHVIYQQIIFTYDNFLTPSSLIYFKQYFSSVESLESIINKLLQQQFDSVQIANQVL